MSIGKMEQQHEELKKIAESKLFCDDDDVRQQWKQRSLLFASGYADPVDPTKHELHILQISDTHNLHDSMDIAAMPDADIVVHCGDFTNDGTIAEFKSFAAFLAKLKVKYPTVLLIWGNHEWRWVQDLDFKHKDDDVAFHKAVQEGEAQRRELLVDKALFLNHRGVQIKGLTVWGSTWVPWHHARTPGEYNKHDAAKFPFVERLRKICNAGGGETKTHVFDKAPEASCVDVYISHGPAYGILDKHIENQPDGHAGGSRDLLTFLSSSTVGCHLFGHVHEQRGFWARNAHGDYECTIEYTEPPPPPPKAAPAATATTATRIDSNGSPKKRARHGGGGGGKTWSTPPPATYPVHLISCNAQKNHPKYEKTEPCLQGSARLIRASRVAGMWMFQVVDDVHPTPKEREQS